MRREQAISPTAVIANDPTGTGSRREEAGSGDQNHLDAMSRRLELAPEPSAPMAIRLLAEVACAPMASTSMDK
jgi:hypothetical protein